MILSFNVISSTFIGLFLFFKSKIYFRLYTGVIVTSISCEATKYEWDNGNILIDMLMCCVYVLHKVKVFFPSVCRYIA